MMQVSLSGSSPLGTVGIPQQALSGSKGLSHASHRRRSESYYYARSHLFRLWDYGREYPLRGSKALLIHFENWLSKYLAHRFCRLRCRSDSNKFLFIKQLVRFQNEYLERLQKRLSRYSFSRFSMMISLTLDPKKFPSLGHEWTRINKIWAKFRSWMYHRFGSFFFIKVVEAQRRGRPHLHVLCGIELPENADEDFRRLLELWFAERWVELGGGQQVNIIMSQNLNAMAYIMKYVKKSICSLGKQNVFGALLFASNVRLFSMNDVRSKGLKAPCISVKVTKTSKYEYLGSVPRAVLKGFLAEYNLGGIHDRMQFDVSLDTKCLFGDLFALNESEDFK